jgi:hypothetical protein
MRLQVDPTMVPRDLVRTFVKIVGATIAAGALVGCYPAMVGHTPEVAGALTLDGVPVEGAHVFVSNANEACNASRLHDVTDSRGVSECRQRADWNWIRRSRQEIASSAGAFALNTTGGTTWPSPTIVVVRLPGVFDWNVTLGLIPRTEDSVRIPVRFVEVASPDINQSRS